MAQTTSKHNVTPVAPHTEFHYTMAQLINQVPPFKVVAFDISSQSQEWELSANFGKNDRDRGIEGVVAY